MLSNIVSQKLGDTTPTVLPNNSSQPTEQVQPAPECSNSNRFAPYPNKSTQSNSSSISTSRQRRNQHATRRVKDTWTHEFVSLGNPDQGIVPSVQKKITITICWVRQKKKIGFGHKDDALRFNDTLESFYPKLKLDGGFQILRSGSNNNLVLIPAPASGRYLQFLIFVIILD